MLNNRVGKQVAIIVCIALVINAGAIFGAQPETEPSNVGGPDAFGYSWTDNKAPSPVIAYNWIEISGTGTDTGLNGGDVADGPFPIGFSFSFYGNAYTQLNLNSKGYISLSTVTFDFSNDPIPNTATPNNIIAAYWDDLAVYNNYGGYCYYETIGASPNRQCVVEWYHICPYGGAGTPQMTFEIILNETGEIWFQYYALNGMSGSSASVGIENIDGTIGLQYCYNTAGIISDGLAIRFSLAQTGQVSITPDQQTSGGLPGSNVDYAFTISNTETQADTFNLSTDNQIIFNGTNWTKYGMVLDIGGVYDSVFAVGPSVIKDNGTYKMWYDGIDGSYGRILYATSIDGLTWIKQGLALDFGGVYESASVYDPCVLKIDGEYKMWYGGDDGVNIRILFANSTDGIAWQKQGLVLDIGGSGEDSVVGGPCVIRDGGLYKMWYTARGTNLQIFYATSPDGLSWTKYGLVLPYGGTYEGSFVFGATVVKDDMYRMWYTGDTGGRKRILYATSPDGAAWTKLGLAVNYGGVPYEDDSVDTPTVLLDGNLAKMWYSGYDWTPASGRIFFATSPYIMQGNQWPVTFRDATNSYNITNISVPASSNAQFIARVSIPGSASIGEYEVATLTATSQNNSAISDTAIINTTCSDSPIIVPHAPIRINSNADFNAAHGVSAGNGSQINPWIIQNYEIDGTGCGYCIYVGNTTDYFTIRNCALHHANGINSYPYFWNTAIICYEVDNAYIMNNSMTFNNQMAIFFYYCTNCVISDNNASYNYGYTIYTEYSTFNTIRNNWVSDGDNCGIAVCWSSHNNTVENNTVISIVDSAFYLYSANGNIIKNNTARGYDYCGINLIALCNYNMVIGNDVSYNDQGLYFESNSNYNRIYHNNIHDNTDQADDYGTNYWNDSYPSGGNYWDDYTGTDGNGDGIGDTPYVIDASSRDYYPLMQPWSQSNGTIVPHSPIRINMNAEFDAAHGVTGGNGTVWAPWVIENYNINGSGYGYCLFIGNTTDYFTVHNCYLHHASGSYASFSFNTGLYLYNTTNGTITGNNGSWDQGNAIYLIYSGNNTITDNDIFNNDRGISLIASNYTTINNNNIMSNFYGMMAGGGSNNTISRNNFSNNTNATEISGSDIVFSYNNVTWNGILGISLGGERNIIANNTASNNVNGIYLYSSNSTVINNTASNNDYGIRITNPGATYNNIIYHNNIINNVIQAFDYSGVNNRWNQSYPTGGNYWSNYTGVDVMSGPLQDQPGPDGIGDTPFIIDSDSKDFYPIMAPDGWLNQNASLVPHAPIRIDSNSEFDAAHGVTGGNGTVWAPWIIENYDINGTGYSCCIYVGNTTNYFIIRNCHLHHSSGTYVGRYFPNTTIALNSVTNGKIENTLNEYSYSGIYLCTSDYNIIYNVYCANNSGGIVMCDYSDYNKVNNSTINNDSLDGIYFDNSDSNVVSNCTISNNLGNGINGYAASYNTYYGNNISQNSQYGIRISSSSGINVYHNSLINNTIQAYDSGSNTFDSGYPSGGNYWSNYAGVDLYSGPGQNISGSDGIGDTPYVIDANSKDYYPFMTPNGWLNQSTSPVPHSPIRIDSNAEFDAAHGVTGGNGTVLAPWIIENYDINGTGYGYCIYIGNTTNYFIVRNCYLHDLSDVATWPWLTNSGINLYKVSNGTISNNTVSSSYLYGHGINVRDSSDNTFDKNFLTNNYNGFNLTWSDNNNIINNVVINNSGIGISIDAYSPQNTITNNTISNNYDGVFIVNSDSNIITNNNVSNNNYTAFWLWPSSGYTKLNTIANNTISNNDYGFYIGGSSNNNTIYHNNIIDNTQQAYDGTSVNLWNATYPTAGNYWSDYTGIDVMSGPLQDQPGSDGIGDTPYVIDVDSQDYYPLMTPNGTGYQPTTVSISVVAGWNLISLPLVPFNTALPNALLDAGGDTLWDKVQWYNPLDPAHWKSYNTGWPPQLNDLLSVNHTMGVWLHVTVVGDGFINVTGTQPSNVSIPLYAGWNMIGFPSQATTYTIGHLKADTGATIVETDTGNGFSDTVVLQDSYAMKAGEGYWVYIVSDNIWDVPNENPPSPLMNFSKWAPDMASNGTTITYFLNYTNVGTDMAWDIEINEYYPSGVTFVSSDPAPTSEDNYWYVGQLAPGNYGIIEITVMIIVPDLLINYAELYYYDYIGIEYLVNCTADTYVIGDATPPTSAVNAISPYWCNINWKDIQATASDTGGGTVTSVELWFRYSPNNITSWSGWTYFGTDTIASPWNWNFTWPNGNGFYQFYSRAWDNFGNYEAAPGSYDALAGFDNIPPTSNVFSISPYIVITSTKMINGQNLDATSGPDRGELWCRYSSNNASWSGWWNWGLSDIPITLLSWNFNFPNSTGYYQFYSRAWDNASNYEVAPGAADAICYFINQTPPTATPIPANGTTGVSLNTPYVISFSKPMNTPNGVATVQPSPPIFGSWAWSPNGMWFNYTGVTWAYDTTYYINLTGFLDTLGNPLPQYQWWFVTASDTTPPSHSSEFPAIDWYTNNPTPEISVHVTDSGSGVDSSTIRFYIDGFSILYSLANITDGFNVTYQHETPYPDGKVVRCRIVASDFDGNALDFTWNFTVDLSAPVHSNETPAPNSTSSNLTPVISVVITDLSVINTGSIKLYVQGYSVLYELVPVSGGYNVSYWHEGGFAQGENVTCRIVAGDICGNLLEYTWNFTVDGIPPLSCAECATMDWWEYVQVTATANDTNGSGVSKVELWYRWSSNNNTWGVWSLFGTDTNGSDGWSWTVYGYPYFQFYTRAWDNAGNYEDAPPVYDVWVFIKHMPKINNDASVESSKSSEPSYSGSAANTATTGTSEKESGDAQAGTQ